MPLNPARSICAGDEPTIPRRSATRQATCLVSQRGSCLRRPEKGWVGFTRSGSSEYLRGFMVHAANCKILSSTMLLSKCSYTATWLDPDQLITSPWLETRPRSDASGPRLRHSYMPNLHRPRVTLCP